MSVFPYNQCTAILIIQLFNVSNTARIPNSDSKNKKHAKIVWDEHKLFLYRPPIFPYNHTSQNIFHLHQISDIFLIHCNIASDLYITWFRREIPSTKLFRHSTSSWRNSFMNGSGKATTAEMLMSTFNRQYK